MLPMFYTAMDFSDLPPWVCSLLTHECSWVCEPCYMTKHNDHRHLESLEVYAGDAALSLGIQRVTGTELMRIVLFKRVMDTMHS
jgi:hypothetical protein